MIKKLSALVSVFLLTFTVNSQAQGTRAFADVYEECGLGAMIFNSGETTSESGRVLAIISNVTWDLGTTAHSSNASSEEQCTGQSMTTAAFILQNSPRIESDVARGEGEYLTAMIETMNCTAPRSSIVSGLRADLTASINSGTRTADRAENAAVLYDSLAQHCAV